MSNKKLNWRINEQIHAPKVRVIGENGKQIGVLTTGEAIKKAKIKKLDLVEIAPKARPPVVKIVDFGKFRYLEEKKLKIQKKKTKHADLKEVRFSPFIAKADYATRIERIKGFFKEGHKIRVVVKFLGRQMGSKQFGYDLLKKILNELGEGINIDMEPKFLGRHLMMVISPVTKSKRAREQESGKTEKQKHKKK